MRKEPIMIRSRFFSMMLVVLCCGLVSGCYSSSWAWLKQPTDVKKGSVYSPSRPFLKLPQGDDPYSQGMRAGCETHMSIVGAGILRTMKPQMDGYKLSEDPMYLRGFADGSAYCAYYLDWDLH